MRAKAVRVITAVVALAGCVGDDNSSESAPSADSVSDDVEEQFMRLDGEAWELKQAIQPLTVTGPWVELEPSLEWWAEYERFEPIPGGVEGIDVRLSGHRASLEVQAMELTGFLGEPASVGSRRAIVATGPDGEPATVSIELAAGYNGDGSELRPRRRRARRTGNRAGRRHVRGVDGSRWTGRPVRSCLNRMRHD